VDSSLVLEAREGADPFDDGLDFLDAAAAARLGAVDDLDAPAAALGVPDVHPEELLGEERRLVAAGSGADLQDDVLVVVGVLGKEEDADLLFERLDLPFQAVGFDLRHFAQLVPSGKGLEHLAGAGELVLHLAQLPDLLDDRGDLPHGAVDLRRLLVIGGDVGAAQTLLERRVAPLDFGELLEHPSIPGSVESGGRPLSSCCRRRRPRRRRSRWSTSRNASGSAPRGRPCRSAWLCR
jgi:hypothetical protein